MSTDISTATAFDIRDGFTQGGLSARDIIEDTLKKIEQKEPSIDAFITLMRDKAMERAEELNRKRENGAEMGALAGVPVALKDNICTRGTRTTCASRILEDFIPPYSAHVVERLEAEDAIIIGKTNMDEFAMGSSTENSAFKPTRNPRDTERVPGGSSGGSAAAVASNMTPLSLGTDTAGSVRQPAALCGIMGLKPTYGRVSRYGVVAFASSMDQVGPFARNAEDMALLLNAIASPDKRDSTCTVQSVPDYLNELKREANGLTFGIPKEFFETEGLSAVTREALNEARGIFEQLGVGFKEISLPHNRIEIENGKISSHAVACYYVLCTAEAASNLARFDGVRYGLRSEKAESMMDIYSHSRTEGFGDEVKRRLMLGTHALSSGYYDAYYLKAARVRRLIAGDMERAFEEVDLIFAPTTPAPAFKIGEKIEDPLEMYLNDVFTSACNLAGNCAISIPCGSSPEGLPIGMQLIGDKWNETSLLSAAAAFQKATDWHE